MENNNSGCKVVLCGTPGGKPLYSHTSRGRNYYTFPLHVSRLSGTEDTINIVCSEDLLDMEIPVSSSMLKVTGGLRTFNNKSGVGNKLLVFVYAHEMEFCDDEPGNDVTLTGTLCKTPSLRVTPLGREICDLLIAVNRPYGRSDYLPCICWGKHAREASEYEVGSIVTLEGRIQSRTYIKCTDLGQLEKTAFEVSASEVSRVANPAP